MNATLPFAQAMVTALVDVMTVDPSVVVLTEGDSLASAAGVQVDASRVIALPVADRAAVAFATGLAWAGKRVVMEIASTGRLPALAEALVEACRTRPGWRTTIVLRIPSGAQAGVLDAASIDLLTGIDGLNVVVPRDAGQAVALFRAALASSTPTILLESRALQRETAHVDERMGSFAGEVVRTGDHAVIITSGVGVHESLVAAHSLAGAGVEVSVVDLVCVAPLRPAAWLKQVVDTGRLVVATNDGALGARVVAAVLADAFLYLEAPPTIVTSRAESIADAVRAALAY